MCNQWLENILLKTWIMLFIIYSTIKILRVIGTICVVMIGFVRFDVVKHDVDIAPLSQSYGIVSDANDSP